MRRVGILSHPRYFGNHRGYGMSCNQPSGPPSPKRNKRYIFRIGTTDLLKYGSYIGTY